ncbi:Carboxylic acid reductase [compost metagenome]
MEVREDLPRPAAERHVLLTGGTGFVGKVVLSELLRRREELGITILYPLIRPRKGLSPEERFAEMASSPCFENLPPGWQSHCRVVSGDICEPGLGLAEADREHLQGRLTEILHCAASVQFNLPLVEATRINVEGTLSVLEFARDCRMLRAMVYVSTAYVTPHPGDAVSIPEALQPLPMDVDALHAAIRAGEADEKALLAQTGHSNTYTFTKCLAENLVAKHQGGIPLVFLRPSIIAACQERPLAGWIDSKAAYAAFVSLYGAGYLHAFQAKLDSRLDIIPCDAVVDRLLAVGFDPAWPRSDRPAIVQAVAGYANSSTIVQARSSWDPFFQPWPGEPRPYLAYMGPDRAKLRRALFWHHELPLTLQQMAVWLLGRKRQAERIGRLKKTLRSIDEVFPYFTRNTFRFESALPLGGGFDVTAYLATVCQGVLRHLLKRDVRVVPQASPAASPVARPVAGASESSAG